MTPLEQLRAMIARTPGSVTATFGIHTAPAILDFEGLGWGPEGQAPVDVEMITLTYPHPDLPGLEPGSTLAAGAAQYRVTRGPRRRGDGLEAVVVLEEL